MKTTVDINDQLLERAKLHAQQKRTTLKALLEEGLRLVLTKRRRRGETKRIRPVVFKGKGLTHEAKRLGAQGMIHQLYEDPRP